MVRGRGRAARGRAVRGRGNGRVHVEDEVAAEPNLAELMEQLRQDQRRGRGQVENEAVEEPNLVEIVAQLQRQVQQQQALINNLQANANRVEVPIDPPAAKPVQNRGVQAATNHEPMYLRFKRMKLKEFNGSTDPLVAQGWLKSIELVLNFMDLTDNEKVKCASNCLMDDARIWWEGIELSRDISQVTWEDFIQEFNEQYFNIYPLIGYEQCQ
ncbi:hypothetical protein TIFTF001_047997 [Ficus carica]|uniref:Ty3 transposon capsid-like protein domain-containing protein n=1 Tax=Ficus carica TaxID=3494 RepID=A0AA87ZP61_FICCA|nr:hypothetical protein TIFTF001_047996 [Ficus carica]GMN30268.1 hypothetical protein TIFTF001_047997 [Ficus carica]